VPEELAKISGASKPKPAPPSKMKGPSEEKK
jgi:hypothetical protein